MAVSGRVSTYAPIWCQSISAEFCWFPVSDLLAYRWLPFAIAPFLLGVVIAERSGRRWFPSSLVAIGAAYGSIFIAVETGVGFQNAAVGEVTIAMAVLVPIAFVTLTRFSGGAQSVRGRDRGDRIVGNLASFIAAFQTRIDRLRYRHRGFGALRASDTPMTQSRKM